MIERWCPNCGAVMRQREYTATVHPEVTAELLEPVGNTIEVILRTCQKCGYRESERITPPTEF